MIPGLPPKACESTLRAELAWTSLYTKPDKLGASGWRLLTVRAWRESRAYQDNSAYHDLVKPESTKVPQEQGPTQVSSR